MFHMYIYTHTFLPPKKEQPRDVCLVVILAFNLRTVIQFLFSSDTLEFVFQSTSHLKHAECPTEANNHPSATHVSTIT